MALSKSIEERNRNTKQEQELIRSVLHRLKSEGRLTPDAVIEEAKQEDSPLHSHFTWDIKEAAEMTWRNQARTLISTFTITTVIHETVYNIQEFVEKVDKDEKEQGYTAFVDIENDPEAARKLVERELGIAQTYVTKVKNYAVVLGIGGMVDGLVAEIENVRAAARREKRKKEKRLGAGMREVKHKGRVGKRAAR